MSLSLRILSGTLLFAASTSVALGDDSGETLFDFRNSDAASQWQAVNDNVMGGVSTGSAKIADGRLTFSGTLSLENSGGFSSIRSPGGRWDLSGSESLVLRVRGDGREYTVNLSTEFRIPAGAYWARFRAPEGQWQDVRVPLSAFEATAFGQKLPLAPPLDVARIRQVGFTLADKKAGPFKLEVESIRAVPKDGKGLRATAANGGKDIVAIAVGAGQFKTLVAAIQAVGLVEVLQGPGPFTVFAPTDAAFEKLPKETLASLLRPENRKKLTAILTYHVVTGRVLLGKQELKTVEGSTLTLSPGGGDTVNGAKVLQADIQASNGVVHAIDTVLLPKLPQDTPQSAARELIELAIDRGVPLFNGGQQAACAAIYELTAASLLRTAPGTLTQEERTTLQKALDGARSASSPTSQAWTLRRALDQVYRSLGSRK